MVSALIFGLVSIFFGVLVMALPKFLRFVVGGYFILNGILLLIAYL